MTNASFIPKPYFPFWIKLYNYLFLYFILFMKVVHYFAEPAIASFSVVKSFLYYVFVMFYYKVFAIIQ
jgi:hypothetical protein